MFFGTKEIKSAKDSSKTGYVLLVLVDADGRESEIETTRKAYESFATETPDTGSGLQDRIVTALSKEILLSVCSEGEPTDAVAKLVETLHSYDARLVDVTSAWELAYSRFLEVKGTLDATIQAKNAEKIVELVGKERLDSLGRVFGASSDAPANSVRQVRMTDIFR